MNLSTAGRHAPTSPRVPLDLMIPEPPRWGSSATDREFAFLQQTFQRHGGLVPGDQVAGVLRAGHAQPISTLARWIASRELVCVVRDSAILLPWFQFDLSRLRVCNGVRESVLELREAFTDWEVAMWFARPNLALDNAAPVDRVAKAPRDVVLAARADRYVAVG